MVEKKKTKSNKGKRTNRELFWIVFVMAAALAILLISPYISQRLNTFDYRGLSFTKERFGQLSVYHYYYFYSDFNHQQYQYNLYLFGDPRKNDVSVNARIIYPRANSTVYVSVNGTAFSSCQGSLRDVASLGNFIRDNGFVVHPGYPDKDIAEMNNLSYVTCDTNPGSMVVFLDYGNETRIDRKNTCYTISVSECRLQEAVEKFEVQSIIDAKNKSVSQ